MSNFNYRLNQLTDSKTYTHIQLPIKNDSPDSKIGLIQDIDFGVMEGFGYSADGYGDSSQINNFVSFVTTVDLLFKNLNTRINNLKSIVDSLNNTYTVILIVNYGDNSSRYEQTVNLGNSASWEMSPPNGYSWPTSVNNGTINGNTITSNVVTESNTVNRKMTVTVTCKASTIAVTNITLNKSSLSINANSTDTITATVSPSDATSKTINWSSDDPTVATVTTTTTSGQPATVTWKKAGTCTITATSTGNPSISKTCSVTCKDATNNYYIGRTNKVEFTLDDLDQYVPEKPSEITLPGGDNSAWTVWIYPESWGKPVKAISNHTKEDEIGSFMYAELTLPEGYTGCYSSPMVDDTYTLEW